MRGELGLLCFEELRAGDYFIVEGGVHENIFDFFIEHILFEIFEEIYFVLFV